MRSATPERSSNPSQHGAIDSEVLTGRLALALAQATLSMLAATKTLSPDVIRAVAAGVANVGTLELSKEETSLLSQLIKAALEE